MGRALSIAWLIAAGLAVPGWAQDAASCLECHSLPDQTMSLPGGGEVKGPTAVTRQRMSDAVRTKSTKRRACHTPSTTTTHTSQERASRRRRTPARRQGPNSPVRVRVPSGKMAMGVSPSEAAWRSPRRCPFTVASGSTTGY